MLVEVSTYSIIIAWTHDVESLFAIICDLHLETYFEVFDNYVIKHLLVLIVRCSVQNNLAHSVSTLDKIDHCYQAVVEDPGFGLLC